MLDADAELYVTDFGLARLEADAGMTMTGDIVGTLRYMAPEQALAKRVVVDHRADVYSLGATLYELLTLEPAFPETDRSELLKHIAFEEPKPLRKHDRHIPAELETIVLKAIAKNPEERFQTAQQLADDLCAFLNNLPIKAKPQSLLSRANKWSRRHRGFVVATAVVLTLLTVGSLVSTALLLAERQRTQQAAAANQALTDFLVKDLLTAPLNEKKLDREVTVSEVLANAESKVAKAFIDQPLIEADVRSVMAATYGNLGKGALGLPHSQRAFALRTEHLGPYHRKTIASAYQQSLFQVAKHQDESIQRCEAAFEAARRNLGPDHPDTIYAMQRLVWIWLHAGDLNEDDAPHVQELCEEALQRSRRVLRARSSIEL